MGVDETEEGSGNKLRVMVTAGPSKGRVGVDEVEEGTGDKLRVMEGGRLRKEGKSNPRKSASLLSEKNLCVDEHQILTWSPCLLLSFSGLQVFPAS